MNYQFNSIYDQNPDEYIVEDTDCMYEDGDEFVSLSFEFMEKMTIKKSVHFS